MQIGWNQIRINPIQFYPNQIFNPNQSELGSIWLWTEFSIGIRFDLDWYRLGISFWLTRVRIAANWTFDWIRVRVDSNMVKFIFGQLHETKIRNFYQSWHEKSELLNTIKKFCGISLKSLIFFADFWKLIWAIQKKFEFFKKSWQYASEMNSENLRFLYILKVMLRK